MTSHSRKWKVKIYISSLIMNPAPLKPIGGKLRIIPAFRSNCLTGAVFLRKVSKGLTWVVGVCVSIPPRSGGRTIYCSVAEAAWEMEHAEARHQLLVHGPGTTDAAGQSLVLDDGFLGCLRPYAGLRERNFHLVMEALLSVGEELHSTPQLDRELVYALWSICHTPRRWGLDPGGMLQRNRRISAADTARLERWVGTVETVALQLLRGWPPHHAVCYYAEYVAEVGWWDNVSYFVGLMGRAVSDPETGDRIETIVQALGKIGPLARNCLTALRAAERWEHTWYTPAERCTEVVRAEIRKAIQAIER